MGHGGLTVRRPAVFVAAVDILERLLADDAVLRIDATTNAVFFQESAAARTAPVTRVEGRQAVIAYFADTFSGRLRLVAEQSQQSDRLATEMGRLLVGGSSFSQILSKQVGSYWIALIRTDDGWRITDVRFEGSAAGSPMFRRDVPVRPAPRPAPPRRPATPPQFGIVPIATRAGAQRGANPAAVQGASAATPTDFAFRFTERICGEESAIESVRSLDGATPGAFPLVLTPSEIDQVNGTIEQMGFFGYPVTFTPTRPAGAALIDVQPATSFSMRVRRNGEVHEVRWSNRGSSNPADPAYQWLEALVRLIHDLQFRHIDTDKDQVRSTARCAWRPHRIGRDLRIHLRAWRYGGQALGPSDLPV